MAQASLNAALMKTMGAIQTNPTPERWKSASPQQLEEGVRCSATVREFPPVIVDEPPGLGGADAGANPVELLLVALGTCQEIMYPAYAAVMGVPLTSVKVNLCGHFDLRGLFSMDPAIPPGYQKIVYETELDSPADRETLRKLVQTVESHCPVLDTLARPIEINGSVTINGQPMAAQA